MNIDTDKLKALCEEALRKSGETYLAFQMSITSTLRVGDPQHSSCEFTCYTPHTGHTLAQPDPEQAIRDTVKATSDAGKLAKEAEKLEEQARQLRARITSIGNPAELEAEAQKLRARIPQADTVMAGGAATLAGS